MAESYRGLTIRIGGDTTKLTQALHTANQAISGTQSSMKKLSDALKMDPSSLRASQLQVGAFAEQAANAATRLITLNDAMRQVGEEVRTFKGSASTIKEMADNWGNVSMKAAQARDYYAELTKTIAANYTELSKLNKEAASAARNEFKSGFNIDKTNFDSMKELVALVDGSKAGINKQLDLLKEMQAQYAEMKNSYAEYQHLVATSTDQKTFVEAAQKLGQLRTQMDAVKAAFAEAAKELKDVKFKGIDFTFDNKNVDLESLKTGLQQAVAASKLTQEEADKLYDKFASLKEMFKDAWNDVQVANQVEGFHDLEAEAAKAEAKVKAVVDEMVRLAKMTETTRGLVTLQQQLDNIAAKSSEAQSRLSSMLTSISESMKNNGGNTSEGLVTGAMQEYAALVDLTRAKIANLQEQISHYTDEEVIALANSTKSLAVDTEMATEKYREQAAILAGYQAGLDDLQIKMDKIAASDPIGNNDAKAIEQYKEYYKQWFNIFNVMQQAKESATEAHAEMTKFVDATNLREKNQELAQEEQTLDKISKMNLKPEVEVSGVEGLKKALEAISDFKFDATNVNLFVDKVTASKTALEAAKKKYEELNNAAKSSPLNKDLFSQRTEALSQYMEKLNAHVARLKQALAGIPSDKIDEAAIRTNTVQENFVRANQAVDDFNADLEKIEASIKKLEQRKLEIVQKDDDSKKRVHEINEELERLKKLKAETQGNLDIALDDLNVATITKKVEEYRNELQAATGTQAKLTEEAKKTSATDGTPKIDEAAFMQVVDRIAQAARRMASEIVQASDQIDAAYRDMRKTVNGTEEDFARLRDAAIEYSKNSFTSSDQMLEMQALGGQLGVAVENLEQFGKIASNLDIATDLDAETVALKLGQISNILGLDIEGMQGFSDALVRLGNNMPAQESAIMAVAQRFGAVAATASFSGDEILGWSAAIAATGQRSEAAATAISNTVSGIEQAVANGGSDLKQFAAIANMSSDEFVDSWKEGPTEVLRAFIEGLKNLKDNNTSAVAALENMGITGVRQQQTLLALTQTVDSLDEALAMSRNAWEGVDDQWGKSGDAANEAQKKAEGFSGALQILKNNVENLAASLGDGMVRPMHVIADAIGIVTDVLNSMPQPVKEVVVALGTAGIAFSALTPMMKVFAKGMTDIIVNASQASSITDFIARLTGFDDVAKAMNLATTNASGLATVLSGSMVIGITAVVGGLTLLYTYLDKWYKKQETLWNATGGLVESVDSLKTAYENYIPESAILSITELRDKTNEVIESQSSLSTSISEKWEELGVQAAMVDEYASKIAQLTEKEQLNRDEQKELIAAVRAYNDLTGESVQVINAQTGELDTSTHSILDNARAWKERAESEAAFEAYKDVVKQRIKDELALADAEDVLHEAQEKAAGSTADMYNGISSANIAVAQAQAEYDKLKSAVDSASATEERLISRMQESEVSITEMRDALIAAGKDTTDFDNLTDEQLAEVSKAYDKTADNVVDVAESIIAAIDRVKAASAGVAEQTIEELEKASKAAAKARAEAYKADAQVEYNERKAALDATYKAAQHGYDAQYRAQQRAFDNQYKAQQKAFDKQYNEAKKTYDKQYDALKKKLDKEYDARKKAYDKQLDALKKSQDAEVKAFQKATDAKLKQMEREYKARLKLLEQEYGSRTDDIDERIKALKGETEAEKKAIETRNQEEKKAELEQAVADARTRRTREEAQQALNDYLQELDAQRNEDARNAEIERLQDQKDSLKTELDERKAILKEQYDEEVAAYKAQREEQLQAIKDANTAEYEAEKERLDGLLEKLKENHTERLEAMKEAQTAQLEAMKESQTAQLEALKQAQSDQLQAMKDSQTASLEAMKAAQTKELQQLKAAQTAKYNQIKAGNDAEGKAQEKKIQDLYRTQDMGDAKISQAHSRYLSGMEKRMQEMGDANIRTSDSSLNQISATHSRYLSGMEKRMQEMGDANIRTADEKNETLNQHTEQKLGNLTRAYESAGTKAPENLVSGISKGGHDVSDAATDIADKASSPVEGLSIFSFTWGSDFVTNFISGMWSKVTDVGNAASGVANSAYMYLHHSVPDKGPLADDDKWGGELIQNLIDGMHDKEHALARQAEKMARIMEDGFDPTLTVDAAYEALDTIGKNRTKSLGSIVETNTAPAINVTLNMNLSDVSFRNDADIDRLARVMSQEMAAQAARQLAGRLG